MKTTLAASATFGPGRAEGRSLLRRLRLWLDLWSERRALQTLDERALADLGLCRADVVREASRCPWDAPSARLY